MTFRYKSKSEWAEKGSTKKTSIEWQSTAAQLALPVRTFFGNRKIYFHLY